MLKAHAPAPTLATVRPYLAIARPDHWCKNVFMLLGILLACFYHPDLMRLNLIPTLLLGFTATCFVASSNYVLTEILDASTDRNHPMKRFRPIPSGMVRIPIAYAEWVGLGVLGLALASTVNWAFFYAALFLLIMGVLYNVPPVRSKD